MANKTNKQKQINVVLINPDVFDGQCDEACKFMNEINRGWFIPPNDISFSLCQQCYCIFNVIRIDPLLEQKFLAIEEKKHFFVCLVSTSLVDIWSNYTTLLKCSVGHDIIKSMICKFFNCFMCNYVRDLTKSNRPSSSSRKIKKLCGTF